MAAKRLAFAHGRTLVTGRLILMVVLAALVAMSVLLTPDFPILTVATIGAIFFAYGLVFVVSPLLTEHWLTRSRLILRQGWYFRAVIPLAEIEEIREADDAGQRRLPLGIHRPMGQPTLFVTGGRTGLVSLRLRQPRRFWQSFGLFATDILFDVDDRTRFLDAFEERRGSLSPIQAEGASADLRD